MMRKMLWTLFSIVLSFSFTAVSAQQKSTKTKCNKIIKVKVPKRAKDQTDMLNLVTPKLDAVRVGIIGLGIRGHGAVERYIHVLGTKVAALCDIRPEMVEKAQKVSDKAGLKRVPQYIGSEDTWKELCERKDIDLVYIATDWRHHTPMAFYAMQHGRHVAIGVLAALDMKEIWAPTDMSEKTRLYCMMFESCVYDYLEIATLNMAQQGLLDEVIHGEGFYIHNLDEFWSYYWNNWRLNYNFKSRGGVYPTHGIGPICQALDTHRGDKMDYLISFGTDSFRGREVMECVTGKDGADFQNDDPTITMIKTEKGKTIQIQHDVVTPRPYSRICQLTGTKGFANKYPISGYLLQPENVDKDIVPDHENLSTHSFMPDSAKRALMEKYKPRILKELEAKAKEVGGHGGMNLVMDYRFIYCLRNGLPFDMDVYDLAE